MAVQGSIQKSTFGTQSNATALSSSHTRIRSTTVAQLNTTCFKGCKHSARMLGQAVRRFGSAKGLSQPLLAASWGSIDAGIINQSRGFAKKSVSAVADSTESDGSSMDPSTEARVRLVYVHNDYWFDLRCMGTVELRVYYQCNVGKGFGSSIEGD